MRYLRKYFFLLFVCVIIVASGCASILNEKDSTLMGTNTVLNGISSTRNPDANLQTNVSTNKEDSNLELNMETEHFIFYCRQQDKKILKSLSDTLESNYNRITNDLKCKVKKKITVEIYKDVLEVTQVSGVDCIGTAKNGKIQIASPFGSGVTDELMNIILVHEFTHMVINNINRGLYRCPWLSEGIAVYEADGPPEVNTRKAMISRMVENESIPTIEDLNTFIYSSDDLYACSYTIIEFIVKEYGYDKLLNLIKSPTKIKNIIGVTEVGLYDNWVNFIKKEYK